MNAQKNLYIGVDGGGTSTTVIALDDSKTVLCTVSSGSTNSNSVGQAKAKAAMLDGIMQAINQSGGTINDVRSVCLGISGCNIPSDAERLVGWGSELFVGLTNQPIITAYNDSYAALASGTMGVLHGIILIAGTGQITKGLNKYNVGHPSLPAEWTAGGNGGLIDDGCGFAMAVDVARAAFQAADGMGPSTPILDDVLEMLREHNKLDKNAPITVEALVPWLYTDFSWGHVAALAPIALKNASINPPDPTAYKIVQKHADYLIRSALTTIRKVEFNASEPVTCVLAGGILSHPLMESLVSAAIKEVLPNADVTLPRVDPAHGAALLAWTQANTTQ